MSNNSVKNYYIIQLIYFAVYQYYYMNRLNKFILNYNFKKKLYIKMFSFFYTDSKITYTVSPINKRRTVKSINDKYY